MNEPDTPRTDVPTCLCEDQWPGQGHHPDCPVRHRIETLERELIEAKAETARISYKLIECEGYRSICRDDLNATRRELADMKYQRDNLAEALKRAQRWIVNHPASNSPDHACRECVPHSDILVDGFLCAYHAALAAVEGGAP